MLGQEQTHVETQSYGTASYAAPELLMEGMLTAKADVFSLGIIRKWRSAKHATRQGQGRAGCLQPLHSPAIPHAAAHATHAPPPARPLAVWELVVAGEELYPGLTTMQVILQVSQSGLRPTIPESCPPALASLMQRCWAKDAAER